MSCGPSIHLSDAQSGAPDADLQPMSKAGHWGHHSSAFDVIAPGQEFNDHPGRTLSGEPDVDLYASPRTNHRRHAFIGTHRGYGYACTAGQHLSSPGVTPIQGHLTLGVSSHREVTIGAPIDLPDSDFGELFYFYSGPTVTDICAKFHVNVIICYIATLVFSKRQSNKKISAQKSSIDN